MQLQKFAKVALLAGSVAALALPVVTRAQTANPATTFSIESIGSKLGLGEADLKQTVLNIVQFALGFMTLIAVILIIYGGFVWLTSAGSEDRVGQAKKIISAAAIGLVIILLAWAIVIFVARTTSNVTTTTGL